jgi:hypothetical protein
MRSLKLITALFIIITGCRQAPANPSSAKADSTLYYPYSPVYSNDYHPAPGKLAQQVLQFWKEWESGDVLHTTSSFADTLTFILPDVILRGSRDSVLHAFKRRRTAYTDMQCYVDSWMPLRETTRNDDLVFVWGRQDGTTGSGRRDYRVIHEIWRFDRAGKIRQLEQYITHPH